MSAGFLNGPPKKAKAAPAKPKVEDHTNVKSKGKNSNLEFGEV